jgi:Zn-dependent protease
MTALFSFLPDVTLPQLIQRVGAMLVILGCYGMTFTWLARMMGDKGPTFDGRFTLNPLPHLDLLGLAAAIFFRVGWMKTVDVRAMEFKWPRVGTVVVVAGSSGALLVLASGCLLARPLVLAAISGDAGLATAAFLSVVSDVAVLTAAINLVPVPPLAGTLLWGLARPGLDVVSRRPRVRFLGAALVVAFLVSGVATPSLRWIVVAFRQLLGL